MREDEAGEMDEGGEKMRETGVSGEERMRGMREERG